MLELLIFVALAVATIFDIFYRWAKPKELIQVIRTYDRKASVGCVLKSMKIAAHSPLGTIYNTIIHKILAAKYMFGGVKMIEKAYAEVNMA